MSSVSNKNVVEVDARPPEAFKTKVALYERLRSILHGYPLGAFVDGADSAFLTACLARASEHYGYPRDEPVYWKIQQQAFWGNAREFVFERPDGTIENPSIKRLSLQKKKGPKDPRAAARRDILQQIKNFRDEKWTPSGYTCDDSQCGYSSASVSEFEVDHDDPTFAEIYELWLAAERLEPTQVKLVEINDDTGRLIDETLGEHAPSFQAFHAKHAKLQLLCRGCHAHKTFGTSRERLNRGGEE